MVVTISYILDENQRYLQEELKSSCVVQVCSLQVAMMLGMYYEDKIAAKPFFTSVYWWKGY